MFEFNDTTFWRSVGVQKSYTKFFRFLDLLIESTCAFVNLIIKVLSRDLILDEVIKIKSPFKRFKRDSIIVVMKIALRAYLFA